MTGKSGGTRPILGYHTPAVANTLVHTQRSSDNNRHAGKKIRV